MLLTDLFVAIKHLPTLPLVFGTYPNIILRNGEMNISSYNSPLECIKSLVNSVIGTTGSVIDLDNDDQITTFFLNGICTDERVWAINAIELEAIFDLNVSPLYNRTNGIFIDLKDCIFERTFDIEDAESKQLYLTLKNTLEVKEKVIVIAHSQGGIIISQLIEHLLFEDNKNLHKLEVYTFASAANNMKYGDYYAEHFANTLDYVARIGVLEYKDNFHGKKYKRNQSGHLLNTHYLTFFRDGMYCAGRSKLSTYLKPIYRDKIQSTMK